MLRAKWFSREGEPSIEAFAEDMRAVLQTASATNPTLVGHSAGGIQAIAFASSATDQYRPTSVITFGTSLTLDRLQERMVLRFSATRLFYALLAAPIVGRLVVRTGAFERRPSPDAITSTIRSARACPRHLKRGWVKAISGRSFVDEVERLLPTVRLGSGDKDTAFSARRRRSSLRRPTPCSRCRALATWRSSNRTRSRHSSSEATTAFNATCGS